MTRPLLSGDPSQLLTTADVARALELTPWTVRYLARTEQLASVPIGSTGLRAFRQSDVLRLGDARMKARLSGVRVFRPKKRGLPGEPRQMSFLGAQLQSVRPRSRSSTEALIPHAESLKERTGS